MMESLKASEEKPPLFRLSEIATSEATEKMIEMLKAQGINVDLDAIDMDEALIADFFTGMLPMANFVVYRDKWSENFHIDAAELKALAAAREAYEDVTFPMDRPAGSPFVRSDGGENG